jgi:hypothetical protein
MIDNYQDSSLGVGNVNGDFIDRKIYFFLPNGFFVVLAFLYHLV